MRRTAALIAGLGLVLSGALAHAADNVPKAVAAAVADSNRPEADTKRDADRHPGEVVAYAGIKAGDKVIDLMPGGGYFTRIFSKVVGPKGHVYAVVANEVASARPTAADGVKAIAADKNYGNVSVEVEPIAAVKVDGPVDVVWTSNNYHDLKIKMFGPADTAAMNKAIFAALKPGGIYMVLDHVAKPGSGSNDSETLHRIDPALVKQEVTAAGFKFVGESKVLHNTTDDHSGKVFDAGMRGKTDQFVYKFQKPK